MRQFIIKREDGGVSVGHIVNDADIDVVVRKWNQIAPSKSVYHMYEDRLPEDENSYFCDVYDHSKEQGVFIPIEKAKAFHVDQLRKIREQKFIELGFPYKLNESVENAIVDEQTKSKLKELRDFPQALDLSNIKDANELRKVIPDCLK